MTNEERSKHLDAVLDELIGILSQLKVERKEKFPDRVLSEELCGAILSSIVIQTQRACSWTAREAGLTGELYMKCLIAAVHAEMESDDQERPTLQ